MASPELTTSPAASPAREKAFGPEVRVSGRRMILNIPMQISRLICISAISMNDIPLAAVCITLLPTIGTRITGSLTVVLLLIHVRNYSYDIYCLVFEAGV